MGYNKPFHLQPPCLLPAFLDPTAKRARKPRQPKGNAQRPGATPPPHRHLINTTLSTNPHTQASGYVTMHSVRPKPEDKENEAVGRAFHAKTTAAAAKAPTTLPTLYLEGFREPLFLDFGQVPLGSSKGVTFAIAAGAGTGRVEVDRCPKGVHVSLGESAGVVEWGPTTLGPIREVLLLRFNKRHRLQITLLGHGVARGAVTIMSAAGKTDLSTTNAPPTTIRQPLHSAFHHNNQRQHPPQGHMQQVILKEAPQASAVNTSFSCAPRRLDLAGGHDENDNDYG